MKRILMSCLALGLLALSPPALAEDINLTKATTSEEVGMTFYKMAGIKPNFDDWIKSSALYASPDGDKDALLASERTRLEAAFSTLDLKNLRLVIRTTVNLRIKTLPNDTKKSLEVTYPAEGTIYFPYVVGQQNISVIPNAIDLYRHIPVTPDEATHIQHLLMQSSATMVVEILPTKADARKPMVLDGVPQWLMLGEIGFIAFYDNNLVEIWSMQAPWYIRKDQQELYNLHGVDAIPGKAALPAKP